MKKKLIAEFPHLTLLLNLPTMNQSIILLGK